MTIILSKDELKELIDLNRQARNTPVICLSLKDGLEGRDLATQAWERAKVRWLELGRKYGFDPEAVKGIDSRTGKVLF